MSASLGGWSDECLAGTGFPPMEGGELTEKIRYMKNLTRQTLRRKAEEEGLQLIKGGFRQTPDAASLYGISYGVYRKAPTPFPTTTGRLALLQADLARLERELAAGERPRAVINKQIESARMELSGLEAEIPKAEAGMPEAGLQQDIFGYQTPVFPKGKGQVTQISMEDYAKLAETWKKAGLPDDALPIAIKPKIDRAKWS